MVKADFKKLTKDKRILIGAGAAVVGIVLLAGFFLFKAVGPKPANTQVATREEVKKLLAEMGKLVELPVGEDPTVFTVTDIEKLKNQPFFQRAKNGDKVLVYSNARKAYLYDPAAKKLIDIAPINVGTPSAQPASPSPSPSPKPNP